MRTPAAGTIYHLLAADRGRRHSLSPRILLFLLASLLLIQGVQQTARANIFAPSHTAISADENAPRATFSPVIRIGAADTEGTAGQPSDNTREAPYAQLITPESPDRKTGSLTAGGGFGACAPCSFGYRLATEPFSIPGSPAAENTILTHLSTVILRH